MDTYIPQKHRIKPAPKHIPPRLRKVNHVRIILRMLHAQRDHKLHLADDIRHRIEHLEKSRSEIDRHVVEIRVRIGEDDHVCLVGHVGGAVHAVAADADTEGGVDACAEVCEVVLDGDRHLLW